ncbi:MAG: terpene cyclase/mutase family protein [bacterium]|nr:terpene cyclase/mutase family protein [bacterium]
MEGVTQAATNWLSALQRSDGGWPNHAGSKTASVMNTAECILALYAAGIDPGNPRITRGVRYLVNQQLGTGPEAGGWAHAITEVDDVRCVPDVVRTSFAVRCLAKVAPAEKRSIGRGVEWLVGRQTKDGGWAPGPRRHSETLPTCFALLALLDVHENADDSVKGDLQEPIERGLQHLQIDRRGNHRYFGPEQGPAAINTIISLLVIAAARRNNFGIDENVESTAVAWLVENQAQAIRPVEVEFEIDCDAPGQPGNYRYLFMTESLLVRLFVESRSRHPRLDELARIAMMRIGENREGNSGAFYGKRVFSWSTAKVLMALCAAKGQFESFPEQTPKRQPNSRLIQVGLLALFALAIFLVLAIEFAGGVTPVAGGLIVALALLAVLVGGYIGEETLQKLFPKSLSRRD